MSSTRKRRQIRRIEPIEASYFDEQFWPVSVALCMTAAIAAGAALSLLSGPWMWASLIAMPLTLVLALLTLQRVRHRIFRRSLQLAVVASAAVHLLLLIFCGLTSIFGAFKPAEKIAENRQPSEKVLLISQRDPNPIWREINHRENPDPEVESEREPTRTESTPPQPIEVERSQPTDSPQANRRTESASSVPHFDQSLSQLRRSEGVEQLKSQSPAAAAAAAPNRREIHASASAPGEERSNPEPSRVEPISSAADSMADASARESAAARRSAEPSSSPSQSPALSQARTRQSQTEIPQTSLVDPQPTIATHSPQNQPPTAHERTTETARSELTAKPLQPSLQPAPETSRTPQRQTAQANRRDAQRNQPSISQELSPAAEPRRSNSVSERVASTVPLESPSAATSPVSGVEAQPQSAATSPTRAATNSAWGENSRNLQELSAATSGAAASASDSAARRRSESTPSEVAAMSAQQASTERSSQADSQSPQSVWEANSKLEAKFGGARQTAIRSSESSAANADSATVAEESRIRAEAGGSQLDAGPTKRVNEAAAERAGGGGAASPGPLNPQPQNAARTAASAQSAAVLASNLEPTQATRAAPSPSRHSGEPNPTDAALNSTREGGDFSRSGDPQTAELTGPLNDFSQAAEADPSGGATRRATNSPATEAASDDRRGEETQTGNTRSGISRAPQTDVDLQLADAEGAEIGSAAARRPTATDSAQAKSGTQRGENQSLEPNSEEMGIQAVSGKSLGRLSERRETSPGTSPGEIPDPQSTARRGGKDSKALEASQDGLTSLPNELTGNARDRATAAEAETPGSNRVGPSSQLDVMADAGPAGLGIRPADALGANVRPASRDSQSLQLNHESRFQRSDSGATPATATDAVIAREAFNTRGQPGAGREPSTELAIEMGLEFLARHQRPDGHWELGMFDRGHPLRSSQFTSDTAATGLAVLAFQGAGYTHREFKYAQPLQKAIDWLIAQQSRDGCLYLEADERSNNNCRMYSHAIATLALTEAYGMTQDARLQEPCRRALAYIVQTQDKRGGWRYHATPSLRESDTSVTGWMMMAMQSGRLIDLDLPQSTWQGIETWLDAARDPSEESRFRYNPFAPDQVKNASTQGRKSTASMSSVGLLMRLYLGWDREDPRMLAGADDLLRRQLPGMQNQNQRDTYYWYYATQVLRHVGGQRWETWNARLHPLLVNSQEKSGPLAGSWNPYDPVPDRWGQHGGRLYVTAMNLLSLEVNYRLLPLYDQTSR